MDARTIAPSSSATSTVNLAAKVVEAAMTHNARAIFIDETGSAPAASTPSENGSQG